VEILEVNEGTETQIAFYTLKIDEINDLQVTDFSTGVVSYNTVVTSEDLEEFGHTYKNFGSYKVSVTPRRKGGVDLPKLENTFSFYCSLPGCDVLPCQDANNGDVC
jgi:hypothetical protein